MQLRLPSIIGTPFACATALLWCLAAAGQNAPAPGAPAAGPAARLPKGLPPRATPGEYLSHAQAGAITIAAEFDQHSVPTAEETLSTEDFVAVEVGIFGAAGAHATVSSGDFSLRINGKKAALPAEQFAAV